MSAHESPPSERGVGPARLKRFMARRHEARKRRVKERALATLKQSLREAGSQLNSDWVREDSDFASFRDDPEFTGMVPPRDPETSAKPWKPAEPKRGDAAPLPIPPRPWGNADARWLFWRIVIGFSLFALAVLVAMFGEYDGVILIAFVILALAAWRAREANSDRRVNQFFAHGVATAPPESDPQEQ